MTLFDLKVEGNKNKDPLDINIKETGKAIVKGAIVIAIGIPLILGLGSLLGGGD